MHSSFAARLSAAPDPLQARSRPILGSVSVMPPIRFSVAGAKVYFALGTVLITDGSRGSSTSKSLRRLMDEVNTSPGRDGARDEQGKAVRESSTEPVIEREDVEKTRQCLLCRSPFPSAWAGERICRQCKSTAAWRNGVVRS